MITAQVILYVLLAGCALSWAYWLLAWGSLRSVLRRRPELPGSFTPRVSLLKPVKGVDAEALENFESFCLQDYPNYEVLFGLASEEDPAAGLIERLRECFPQHDIRVVISEPLGTNPKAAVLEKLASEARGEVLVISDSDIRVTPQYLRRAVAPLNDPRVGLVTCLYRGEMPRNIPARLEALYMDSTFAPSAALAWRLGTDVGCGATLAMRASDLARSGGYAAIADHLLDDYQIAARMVALGLSVQVSDYPVASVLGSMRFGEQWDREVRWSRGIRSAHPLRYPGLLVTFSTPLAIAAACFSGVWPLAWVALVVSLAVRALVAWRCALLLGQRERTYLLLLPLRDLLTVAVWCTGLLGRRVNWRGQQFLLRRDGRLEPLIQPRRPSGPLARAVRWLDGYLRVRQGIFEYSDDEECLLRVSVEPAQARFDLGDGTHVSAGDPVCVIHLWNDHMPIIPPTGPDLTWAIAFRRAMGSSFAQLAVASQHDYRLLAAKAFGADATFVSRNGNEPVAKVLAHFGFERVTPDRKPTVWGKIHQFGENFLLFALLWAFNPSGMKGKSFFRPREPIWMSRKMLLRKHGSDRRAERVSTQAAPVAQQSL